MSPSSNSPNSSATSSAPDFPAAHEPVLNLDTLIRRPCVEIDGRRFDILSPDELSVIDSHRFSVNGRRIEELAGEAGEEAEVELTGLIDLTARKVAVGVPAEVFAKLSGSHKWAIVDVFTGLLLGNRLGVAGAMQKAMGPTIAQLTAASGQLTGASASPGSSGSMAGTRPGGWRKRLRRWCGLT